jgi:phospholipase C
MDCYDESDVPYYYALARAFAISDAHFCSLMGPTDPNRLYSLAATSFGLVDNEVAPANDPSGQPYPNIFTELNAAHVTWKYYVDTSPPESVVLLQTYLTNASHYAAVSSFMSDAAAGQLPQVAIVEGHATSDGTSQDEHPPADIQVGQAFSAGVVNALMASPNWMSSALFFTYDEHGGFYDSVPPPKACPPDALQPILNTTNTYPAQFDRYGFRVPLIVVSPYAKRGYVSHVVTDHTSVLRFIEARFGLPAMTARDANADPLFDMFDFSHRDTSVPALPAAAIDPTEYSYCTSLTPANDTP